MPLQKVPSCKRRELILAQLLRVKLTKYVLQPPVAVSADSTHLLFILQYGAQREILENIGCNIESSKREKYSGIAVFPGPSVVLKPDFVLSPSDYEQRFPFPTSVSITSRSTLVVRGSGVVIESLQLDGTLIIDYPDGKPLTVRDMVVQNAGWVRIADEESDNEIIKMRGYHIEKRAEESLTPPSACVIS